MNRGLMITLVSAVAVLAIGVGSIAWYVFAVLPQADANAGAASGTSKGGEAVVDAATHKMNKFVTNLGDTDRLRYIDFTIALGLKGTASEETVKNAEPQIRDMVLKQVRELKAADLAGAAGKDRLAEVIQTGLAELLPGHVTRVYVTDMVIQ